MSSASILIESFLDGTTDYVPIRSQRNDNRKTHISDQPITIWNWAQHINWFNTVILVFVPSLGLLATYWVSAQLYTIVFSIVYYFFSGLGITAGYHRLWAHTSYKATLPLKIFLLAGGAASLQGSARWWSRHHRAHHRYTDTDKDPYSVHKGLIYSHIGWVIFKQNPRHIGRTDITDLNENYAVIWQHKHYFKCGLGMAWVLPTVVCGLGWNDWTGGFLYAGILRTFFFQQATFCVNSLAHWLGEQPFDDRHSPRDHVFTALITLGEGYHNFHHEFPSDYRNGIEWWQYDPTKWAIWIWKQLGLAYDLKEFRLNEIEKGRLQQQRKKLDQKCDALDWGTPLDQLPVWIWDGFVAEAEHRPLIAIEGVVYDVSNFVQDHPGGKMLISSAIGKDGTAVFNGGVYQHSNAASNLLSTMRVGILRGGCEVEVWKDGRSKDKALALPCSSRVENVSNSG